jgi:hypothetical protein
VSDPRWDDVVDDAASATEHFRAAVALYEAGGFEQPGLDGYRAAMAFMHAVQSAHTSLEGGLLRILDILQEQRPIGDQWHGDLVRRACREIAGENARPPILSPALCEAIDETRKFRNLAVRNYERFQIAKALPTVTAARLIAEDLMGEIARFRKAVDDL